MRNFPGMAHFVRAVLDASGAEDDGPIYECEKIRPFASAAALIAQLQPGITPVESAELTIGEAARMVWTLEIALAAGRLMIDDARERMAAPPAPEPEPEETEPEFEPEPEPETGPEETPPVEVEPNPAPRRRRR